MAGVHFTLFWFLIFGFFFINSVSPEQKIPSFNRSKNRIKRNTSEPCVGFKEIPLTYPEKNYLLWLHTNLRENLTKEDDENLPKAYFMKKLSWNENLSKMAQRWAEKCWPMKNPNPQFANQPLGQQIMVLDEKNVKGVKDLFLEWAAGLKHLDHDIISKYRKPKPGEFDYEPASQLIWWNTSQIGCGRSSYKLSNCQGDKTKNCSKQTVVQLVCNYFPAGNREGDPVYIPENNNKLICQYDEKSVHCKNLTAIEEKQREDEAEILRKRHEMEEHIRNKLLEVWPAAARGISLRPGSGYLCVLVLLLMIEYSFSISSFFFDTLFT